MSSPYNPQLCPTNALEVPSLSSSSMTAMNTDSAQPLPNGGRTYLTYTVDSYLVR
jgi:hypothetical protein